MECRVDGQPLDSSASYRLSSTYYTLNDITDDPDYDFIGLEPGEAVENVRVEEVLWEIVEDWMKAHPDSLTAGARQPALSEN